MAVAVAAWLGRGPTLPGEGFALPEVDIARVFTAASQSLFELLTVEGQGCYVPAYQRPYAWDTDNVHRLLEDATLGLEALATDEDSIRFLGR